MGGRTSTSCRNYQVDHIAPSFRLPDVRDGGHFDCLQNMNPLKS
jgi:hypothetical protein